MTRKLYIHYVISKVIFEDFLNMLNMFSYYHSSDIMNASE